jgi:hypothetical protein
MLMSILDGPSKIPTTLPIVDPAPISEKGSVQKKRAGVNAEAPLKPARIAKGAKFAEVIKLNDKKAVQRRRELNTMKLSTIRDIVTRRGLPVGSKDKMIEAIIVFEAERQKSIRKHKDNAQDVLAKRRQELSKMTKQELNDLLKSYALQTGGTKPACIERLLATLQEQREIQKALTRMAMESRRAKLMAMDEQHLYQLCMQKGVDPFSKDVLMDRLLVQESAGIWQEVIQARNEMSEELPLQ